MNFSTLDSTVYQKMFASRAISALQPSATRLAISSCLINAAVYRCTPSAFLRSVQLAQLRQSSSGSAGTEAAMSKRLEMLGADASKPTLDIEPFAKSERLHRPISPHLTIYQPQLTWYLSAAFRATSGALAVGFYGVALAYVFLPISSVAIASFIHSLPAAALFLGKFTLAAPISFHLFNGLRHLIWDTATLLNLKGVYNSGYTVLGLSAVAAVLLALL
ncbi:succinate dehydrogenase, cytochrome b556 subunit [Batrachochytrium dendrobatidis JEL423]|nr:succinate dehydrogenase, cytochrome b556 subunit [Batrachochytrium dendrobatidis JEL423]